jgi:hypothetical protein
MYNVSDDYTTITKFCAKYAKILRGCFVVVAHVIHP